MATLSDIIETFIKSLLEENDGEKLQIQRNELASQFSCAPSQINYVLTTRFTTDKGYIIESRRGGGGYIVIRQTKDSHEHVKDMINEKIGESITCECAISLIEILIDIEILKDREGQIVKMAINDRALASINIEDRNKIRAELLKSMIMVVLS
ncbi:CtsR family transcriptional regulator [Clostridium algidicarnis]|uniref:CtsR family transcriptional regulator n=1 Tax=Clostridium algidicarnis TaxID=37659 RepID=UPI001C0C6F5C|nr:CtsR family transcriptional regulator [Clostridium algidicarnis]MBU3212712.1 CtsR family transcriptional regulator [Clostridium algidicarnis]MBU3223143.1 CtsR family transcriptional regulator [Clostridium algidicarnis]